jgi:hypothetical protein
MPIVSNGAHLPSSTQIPSKTVNIASDTMTATNIGNDAALGQASVHGRELYI